MTAAATERATFTRTFEAALAEGDGRTLDARIVPYGVPGAVADPPDFRPYREMFVAGAFERQLAVPERVRMWLNFEHDQGLRGIVGHGVQLRDQPDGLHGSFRVHDNVDGDKALQLIHEGVLSGLSLEFAPMRSRTVDGVVQRLRAHIDKVSLCRFPAYQGAEVLSVREQPDDDDSDDDGDSDEEPVPASSMTVAWRDGHLERLATLGIEPLRRIATTGTSWDGSPGRFTDEQYRRATLLCRGASPDSPKTDCSLPVLEPDGTLNTNALGAAAAALAGARGGVSNASQSLKASAARKLVRYYNQAGMEPPASLRALAGS